MFRRSALNPHLVLGVPVRCFSDEAGAKALPTLSVIRRKEVYDRARSGHRYGEVV
jgi:hypothetical protein